MNTILLKTSILLFCILFVCKLSLSKDETVKVKTFLVIFEEKDRFEPNSLWEKDFILKFQWEPEGLYVITKLEVIKNQLDDVFQNLNAVYSIENSKIRELPKKMFHKLY